VRSIVFGLSVCLPLREQISNTGYQKLSKSTTHIIYSRGSVVLWWRCDTLCTSAFVNHVIFAHNGQAQATQ